MFGYIRNLLVGFGQTVIHLDFTRSLKKDNQRFILEYDRSEAGGSEGSWCLLTLPEKDSVDSTIYLYDYGYSPF